MNKLFGTDGIRGQANAYPMTPELVVKLGLVLGKVFKKGNHRHKALIGKDTRLSGYMIESCLKAGLISAGIDTHLLGPIPTAGISLLTPSMRADFGIMISASHNAYKDNGIKIFDSEGNKISDELEQAIEQLLRIEDPSYYANYEDLGRIYRIEHSRSRYIEMVKSTFPKKLNLFGIKIVLDCANGAAYNVAKDVFYELGAEVVLIGAEPNGKNINLDCGSTHPALLQATVIQEKAHIGIGLDGDADRIIVVDEKGQLLDGEVILAVIIDYWFKKGKISNNTVVSTQIANLGLEQFVTNKKLRFIRTAVGDKFVTQAMKLHGANIGGEPSGHIILSDFVNCSDGITAGLQLLASALEAGCAVSEFQNLIQKIPQIQKNVRIKHKQVIEQSECTRSISAIQERLGATGRLIVRSSGTEPLIRIILETPNITDYEADIQAFIDLLLTLDKTLT